MSEGEAFLLIALAPIAAIYWGAWLRAALLTSHLVRPYRRLAVLTLCWVGSLGVVLITLLTAADPVVRNDTVYIVLFLEVAIVALAAATAAAWLIGISPLEDAIRRPNTAAVWATAGLWVGTSMAVAGANIGRGDTIGTTNGPLVLGVATLVVLWAVLAAVVGTRAITQDRDAPSGVRLAGLFVAWGLILGRATAGNWESVAGTLHDFVAQGWPVVALLVIAMPIELLLRPRIRRPSPPRTAGTRPAIIYLLIAAGWVVWLGRP